MFINNYVGKEHIFTFNGSMGAGKTTFIYELCKQLNILDEVSSPTYSIVQLYNGVYNNGIVQIAHMDWFRIIDETELWDIGIQEYLNNINIITLIEWPSKGVDLLSNYKSIAINIDIVSETERHIII